MELLMKAATMLSSDRYHDKPIWPLCDCQTVCLSLYSQNLRIQIQPTLANFREYKQRRKNGNPTVTQDRMKQAFVRVWPETYKQKDSREVVAPKDPASLFSLKIHCFHRLIGW